MMEWWMINTKNRLKSVVPWDFNGLTHTHVPSFLETSTSMRLLLASFILDANMEATTGDTQATKTACAVTWGKPGELRVFFQNSPDAMGFSPFFWALCGRGFDVDWCCDLILLIWWWLTSKLRNVELLFTARQHPARRKTSQTCDLNYWKKNSVGFEGAMFSNKPMSERDLLFLNWFLHNPQASPSIPWTTKSCHCLSALNFSQTSKTKGFMDTLGWKGYT